MYICPYGKERNINYITMIRKDILKEIILLNQNRDLSSVINREIELPINTGKIVSVTGVRRCGKTHLLLFAIKKLIGERYDKSKLVYINFEDERLIFEKDDFDRIVQAYLELYPETNLKEVFFFFDEIQNQNGWEKFVRRLYDNVSRNIFITGSNSKMLSVEIASSLRGRNINIELFPLSFKEFLRFRNIDADYLLPQSKAIVVNSFSEYLKNGGFPEVIDTKYPQKILQDYFYVMLYKDLVERYQITNVTALKYFLTRILLSTGKPSSIHKIYNELKSAGYKISKDSLYQFADYAESAYFSFRLSRFDYSFVKQELSEKKTYFIDNGLLNSLTWQFSDNLGGLLENMVYLHIRRSTKINLFFFKDKTECDFLIFDKDKLINAIQVSYDISNKETFAREVTGLEDAATYFGIKRGTIITFDQELDTFVSPKGIEIKVVPGYKWFLSEGN